MIRVIYSICLLLLFAGPALKAQQPQDAGLWLNMYVQKKLSSNWNIHLNQETRFQNNMSHFEFAYLDLGVTHKVAPWLNTTVAYVFVEKYYITKHNRSAYWSTRHQVYANLTFKKELGAFKLSLREQLQSDVKDIYSSDEGAIPFYHFRNKLTVKYPVTRRITPYIADELYYQLNNPEGNEFDRNRFFAGVFYRFSKKNEAELYFLHQLPLNNGKATELFVTGLGFSHEF